MGVEEEAKASGMCDRASEETKTRSHRRSHQRDQKPPQLQKKEMDQQTPEENEEPQRAAEVAFVAHKLWRHLSQKYPHSKVRKRQQGNPTCKPSRQHRNWNTLTQGVKPQPPQQASEAGEAQKMPNTLTQGVKPQQASEAGEAQKIPMYQQQGKQRTGTEEKVAARPLQPHRRVDQQTGDRHAKPTGKGAEPRRGSSGRGSCAGTKKKTRGEQDNCHKTTPNPMRNHHRRSRAANLSQTAEEPQRGRQLHDTERKNRRCSMTS